MADLETYNLKDYKQSKIAVEHIEAILLAIGLSIRALQLFKIYLPVAKILDVMQVQQGVLESALKKIKEVKRSKGKVG